MHVLLHHRRAITGIVLLVAISSGLHGQSDDYTSLKWWHPVAASVGVAALFLVDEPIQEFWQDNRADLLGDVSDVAKRFKDPEVFWIPGLGAMGLGLAIDRPVVTQTGVQILTAYGLSSAMMISTKELFGRTRPSQTPDDELSFDWLGGSQNTAFPSGSAAVVFSLATTVSDALDNPMVSAVLYGGAVLNSWSRVYGNRHWFSDVALGALYGITAAKLVNGRWRLFGQKPPTVFVGHDGTANLLFDVAF